MALLYINLGSETTFAKHRSLALSVLLAFTLSPLAWAQTSPPPSFGEETKGTPAINEITSTSIQVEADNGPNTSAATPLFGTSHVTESRRENGQRYLIELEHSTGSKQYIEELDSDGKIESTSNDIEETPNLPKWKLGSW
ncbi:MAG: hypothetical protein ACI9FR_002052 [Cryomorphaceae bacterium]|jgi:hypothetical protein